MINAENDCGISDEELKSLARVLYPEIKAFMLSEEGQKMFAEIEKLNPKEQA